MYSFRNDYSEGAHPSVLKALQNTNLEQTCGYGLDHYCAEAASLIQKMCGAEDLDVHFVVGGTQANLLAIHAFIHSFEAAIAAETGHINVHETGAIELTGHKVISVPTPDGKLTPPLLDTVLSSHSTEHMVRPRIVYLSDSTEIGTIYTRCELAALRSYCDQHDLFLYLDGARLGSALTAPGNDVTMRDLYTYTDAFYIGGTKNGILFGEALVLVNDFAKANFRYYMKQRGAMLAKGRLLGIQFCELLKNDLYFELARHANEMAARLRDGISRQGYAFTTASCTNQLFPALPNAVIQKLCTNYDFDVDQPISDDLTRVRLVTSWATPVSAVDAFVDDLAAAKEETAAKNRRHRPAAAL